jgi:gas vesicle protein
MNRFWRGMLTGMFVGAAMGMWLAPHMEGDGKDALVSATRGLADRAERMFRRGRNQVNSAMDMMK